VHDTSLHEANLVQPHREASFGSVTPAIAMRMSSPRSSLNNAAYSIEPIKSGRLRRSESSSRPSCHTPPSSKLHRAREPTTTPESMATTAGAARVGELLEPRAPLLDRERLEVNVIGVRMT
jgi:hypothetical protein